MFSLSERCCSGCFCYLLRGPALSRARSGWITGVVSSGGEVVAALVWPEDPEDGLDRLPERAQGAGRCAAQQCFQFGEGKLDRAEAGRVRREVEQPCTGRLDRLTHARHLVSAEV